MSYLSELDSSGFDQRNTEDLLSERAPVERKPGFFAGLIKGPAAGFMRGLTNLNDLGLTATDLVYPMSDEERDAQAGIRRKLTDYFTPDANTVGTAGRVLGGVTEGLAPLVVPGAGPALMVGSNTLAAGKRLVDQGVDSTTAGGVAALEGAASYAGLKLPILGSTLGQRLAAGAVGNLALGAGSTEADRVLLDQRGYAELAKNYDPGDIEARAVDLLSGLVFGGLHHLTLPSQRDAVATLTNAKHFQKDTAPGIPADPQASAAHQRAMETATEQLLRGEPVNVDPEVTRANFEPRDTTGNPLPEELRALDAAQQEWAQRNTNLEIATQSGESVKPEELPADESGYSVAEGELTDEQLAQFQGLRSDVPGDQNVRTAGEGVPGQSGNPNDGGPRGEPLKVFRGAGRELSAQDFHPEALGHATEHPSSGLGVFFTNSAEHAANYGKVSEHLLDVRNPKVIPVEDFPGLDSLAAYRDYAKQLRAEGYDGVVIDASHLGGPVNYVAFEHSQVKRLAKTSTTSDARLQDPETRAKIEQVRSQVGLEERGGRLIRNADGEVTGRTKHLGSPLWKDRPAGITKEAALKALDNVKAGKPLGAAQGRFVKYLLDELDSVRADTEKYVNEAAANVDSPAVAAVRDMLDKSDLLLPTGELDAEGNVVTRSAREILAEADAEVDHAEQMGQGIAAAVSCFLTRGA